MVASLEAGEAASLLGISRLLSKRQMRRGSSFVLEMAQLQEQDLQVLRRYPRALMHLRDRQRAGRLALGLGAGVSLDLGFPNWKGLVDRLSSRSEFDGARVPQDGSLTVKTQALIQHLGKSICPRFAATAETEREVRYKWIQVLHEELYRDIPSDVQELCRRHPYLGYFLENIKSAPLTINYNFDDSIERMLGHTYRTEQECNNERIFETIWEPSTQFRRSKGVIYHPNGFLPLSLVDGFSENLVFSEGEFADQLIDVMSGHYSTLTSHLTNYTCLFLGLSLSDSTLKHLLRQNVHCNPGHPHYYIRYSDQEEIDAGDEVDAETLANFDVYGVVTLRLSKTEMGSLGRLLSCSDPDFREVLDRLGIRRRYVYYISGAVGAGKSSVVQQLRCLSTLSEWVDQRPTLLEKPHLELTQEQRHEVDTWISAQFRRKNFRLITSQDGILACDRTPLDPLAFAKPTARSQRAREHLNVIQPNPGGESLVPGHVILLTASAEELMARAKERHKGATLEYLRLQQSDFRNLFGTDSKGVTELSTSSRSLAAVVRAVSKVIHLGEYAELDLAAQLRALAEINA